MNFFKNKRNLRFSQENSNIQLTDYGYVAANIYFSAVCNLQCSYCFQPKFPKNMKEVNHQIVDWITSGKMEDDLEKYFGPGIEALALWGGEPTLNLPYLQERLSHIYKRFEKLKDLSFSTNLAHPNQIDYIVNFIEVLDILNTERAYTNLQKVSLRLQISIDGPPEITNKNRVGLKGNSLEDNITLLVEKLSLKDFKNIPISISLKSTQNEDTLLYLSDFNNLKNYYSFFDNCYTKWSSIVTDSQKNLIPKGGEFITLAVPGNYTVNHGRAYAKINSIILSEDFRKLDWNNDLIFETQLSSRVVDFFQSQKYFNRTLSRQQYMAKTLCSSPRSCAGITYNGEYHLCQTDFFFDKDLLDALESSPATLVKENPGFEFLNYRNLAEDKLKASYLDKKSLLNRLNINLYANNYPGTFHQCAESLLKELSLSGLVSKCFSEDNLLLYLAACFFTQGSTICMSNNTIEFGSPWITSDSVLKVIFNGAFETILQSNRVKELF